MTTPKRCPTCGHVPRIDTRTYADRRAYLALAARARRAGRSIAEQRAHEAQSIRPAGSRRAKRSP